MKKILTLVIAFVFLGIGVYLILPTGGNENKDVFIIGAQNNANVITVESVYLNRSGFIVAREVLSGKPGQVVEVSQYLNNGVNMNVQIDIEGIEYANSADLIVVVYEDNGDGGFNPNDDMPAYFNGEILARYVKTGEAVSEIEAVPNTVVKSDKTADVVVIYTDDGFVPSDIAVSEGDTVEFVNKSSRSMWVASDVHPAHTILPTFDQFKAIGFGEKYQYTFDKVGEWRYHDHVNASETGVIIVNK